MVLPSIPKYPLGLALGGNAALILFALGHGLLHPKHDASRYFGEGRYTMAASCFQLLLTAWFSFRIFFARGQNSSQPRPKLGKWLWLLIGAGFVFLSFDEAFQFHENIDRWMQRHLHLPDNGFTDRIDDAIVGLYLAIGLGVLWVFRWELADFKSMLRPLLIGFGMAVISVVCDALSNRPDFFVALSLPRWAVNLLMDGCSVGDGAFTLLAEGLFALAFYLGWKSVETAVASESIVLS